MLNGLINSPGYKSPKPHTLPSLSMTEIHLKIWNVNSEMHTSPLYVRLSNVVGIERDRLPYKMYQVYEDVATWRILGEPGSCNIYETEGVILMRYRRWERFWHRQRVFTRSIWRQYWTPCRFVRSLSYLSSIWRLNRHFLTRQKLIMWFPFVSFTPLKSCHHFFRSGLRIFCIRPAEDLFWGQKQNQVNIAFLLEPT
jgi:hypothetical protein